MQLIHHRLDGVDTVVLSNPSGQADTLDEARQALEAIIATGQGKLILDLGGMEALDAGAIALLAFGYRASRAKGGEAVLLHVQPVLRAWLSLTRLSPFFPVFDDQAAAIAYLGR